MKEKEKYWGELEKYQGDFPVASYPERDISSSTQEINFTYRAFKTNFNSSELAIY